MLSYIKGNITFKSPAFVILELGGIGYEVQISLHTYSQIQSKENCKLFTYMNVKSEGQSVSAFELYGFADSGEREVFKHLISVSGIGANTARMMLSSMSPSDVRQAIVDENVAVIQSIKGIGPKTAKRLILELKEKLFKTQTSEIISSSSHNTTKDEALSALVSLGINKSKAEKAVFSALKTKTSEPMSVEALIKESLKNI
ncbi:MAG: Holliday junction branch migration protein RuvA [Chitinophagales bacterium]|nr:Holliday junction branch migration protein RuvA [Chitinophagales bacterium]